MYWEIIINQYKFNDGFVKIFFEYSFYLIYLTSNNSFDVSYYVLLTLLNLEAKFANDTKLHFLNVIICKRFRKKYYDTFVLRVEIISCKLTTIFSDNDDVALLVLILLLHTNY